MKYAKADDYVGIVKQRKVIDGKLYRQYFVNSKGVEIGIPIGVYNVKFNDTSYVGVRWNKTKVLTDVGAAFSYADRITQENSIVKCIDLISTYGKGKCSSCCSTRTKGRTKALHPAFVVDISDVPTGVYVFTSIIKQKNPTDVNKCFSVRSV